MNAQEHVMMKLSFIVEQTTCCRGFKRKNMLLRK